MVVFPPAYAAEWEYAHAPGPVPAYFFGNDVSELDKYAQAWTTAAVNTTRWANEPQIPWALGDAGQPG